VNRYDDLFVSKGAVGNIGQRKAGVLDGVRFIAQVLLVLQ
jgi:hypothetical protein